MAEPSASAVAVGLASAGILAGLGLEPGPIVAAFVGGSLGMSFAPKMELFRTWVVFFCVMYASALLGGWAAVRWLGGDLISKNACSLLVALFFHPATAAILTKAPEIIDDLRRRFLGAKDAA